MLYVHIYKTQIIYFCKVFITSIANIAIIAYRYIHTCTYHAYGVNIVSSLDYTLNNKDLKINLKDCDK